MKINVEPMQSTESWHYKQRTGLELRTFANDAFQTTTGEIWYAGSPFKNPSAYQRDPLTLNGDKLAFPEIQLDTTEDSPTHPDPRFSSYVFAGKRMLFPHLLGYAVPQTIS